MWGAEGLLSVCCTELVAFRYHRLIVGKLLSRPEILRCEREGGGWAPRHPSGWWFKRRRISSGRWYLNTFWRVARWLIVDPINHPAQLKAAHFWVSPTALAMWVGKFLWQSIEFTIRSLSQSIMLNNQTGRKYAIHPLLPECLFIVIVYHYKPEWLLTHFFLYI